MTVEACLAYCFFIGMRTAIIIGMINDPVMQILFWRNAERKKQQQYKAQQFSYDGIAIQ
jgi:hypothetical protein